MIRSMDLGSLIGQMAASIKDSGTMGNKMGLAYIFLRRGRKKRVNGKMVNGFLG